MLQKLAIASAAALKHLQRFARGQRVKTLFHWEFVGSAKWHGRRMPADDVMMRRARKAMTIRQLKRSMDTRFRAVDRRFKAVDRRFAEQRRYVDKRFTEQRRYTDEKFAEAQRHTNQKFAEAQRHTDQKFAEAQRHTDEKFAELRRHFDVVIESLHDDFRIFADAIRLQSERLDRHEFRIGRLEQRTV